MNKSSLHNSPNEIRKFFIPPITFTAKKLHKLVDLHKDGITEPPLTINLSDEQNRGAVSTPIIYQHPCHSQVVERHVRLVSQASSCVSSFDRRDGMIRQRIKSHSLMKTFDCKGQYALGDLLYQSHNYSCF